MNRIKLFEEELSSEAALTRKMLAVVPNDRYDWKPHPKSMSIKQLVTHIAELPSWIVVGLNSDELDFANTDYKPEAIDNSEQALEALEKNISFAEKALKNTNEATLDEPWVMKNGEEIYMNCTKGYVIRMSLSQTIHHRAQLGVFLRLLDVPIPGSYGPSADEMSFT